VTRRGFLASIAAEARSQIGTSPIRLELDAAGTPVTAGEDAGTVAAGAAHPPQHRVQSAPLRIPGPGLESVAASASPRVTWSPSSQQRPGSPASARGRSSGTAAPDKSPPAVAAAAPPDPARAAPPSEPAPAAVAAGAPRPPGMWPSGAGRGVAVATGAEDAPGRQAAAEPGAGPRRAAADATPVSRSALAQLPAVADVAGEPLPVAAAERTASPGPAVAQDALAARLSTAPARPGGRPHLEGPDAPAAASARPRPAPARAPGAAPPAVEDGPRSVPEAPPAPAPAVPPTAASPAVLAPEPPAAEPSGELHIEHLEVVVVEPPPAAAAPPASRPAEAPAPVTSTRYIRRL
jgi:hypothetical protein